MLNFCVPQPLIVVRLILVKLFVWFFNAVFMMEKIESGTLLYCFGQLRDEKINNRTDILKRLFFIDDIRKVLKRVVFYDLPAFLLLSHPLWNI